MPNLPPLPITGTLAERLHLVRNRVPYETALGMNVAEVTRHILALADLDDLAWFEGNNGRGWGSRDPNYLSREDLWQLRLPG